MLQHKYGDLLAVNTLRLHCSRSSANEVAHRFMPFVRDTDRRQLSGPLKLGKAYPIAQLVLTRSPGFLGTSEGATTSHGYPMPVIRR